MPPILPRYNDKCYACDARAIGVRDQRPEGVVEAACYRHLDPSLRSRAACCFCGGFRPSVVMDGGALAHIACIRAANGE